VFSNKGQPRSCFLASFSQVAELVWLKISERIWAEAGTEHGNFSSDGYTLSQLEKGSYEWLVSGRRSNTALKTLRANSVRARVPLAVWRREP